MKCEKCNSEQNEVKIVVNQYKIKDKVIEFEAPRRVCKNCGEYIYDEKLDNKVAVKAIELYNENYGILPQKIKKLRNHYQLSQEIFAKILGCAKKTIISYENGQSIPNDIYLTIMKSLLKDPNIISLYIDVNKDKFTKKELQTIHEKITLSSIERLEDLNEYNGYMPFNKEKVKHMIIKLLETGIGKTKLLKEMFYADFTCYKKTTCSITGLVYQHQQFGPVPCQYEDLLNSLLSEGVIDYQVIPKGNYEEYHYSAIEDFNPEIFTEEELVFIEFVIEKFKDYNAKDIEDYSHQEKAWLETKDFEKINYNYAFALKE